MFNIPTTIHPLPIDVIYNSHFSHPTNDNFRRQKFYRKISGGRGDLEKSPSLPLTIFYVL